MGVLGGNQLLRTNVNYLELNGGIIALLKKCHNFP